MSDFSGTEVLCWRSRVSEYNQRNPDFCLEITNCLTTDRQWSARAKFVLDGEDHTLMGYGLSKADAREKVCSRVALAIFQRTPQLTEETVKKLKKLDAHAHIDVDHHGMAIVILYDSKNVEISRGDCVEHVVHETYDMLYGTESILAKLTDGLIGVEGVLYTNLLSRKLQMADTDIVIVTDDGEVAANVEIVTADNQSVASPPMTQLVTANPQLVNSSVTPGNAPEWSMSGGIPAPMVLTMGHVGTLETLAHNFFYEISPTRTSVDNSMSSGTIIFTSKYTTDLLGGHAKTWVELHEYFLGVIHLRLTFCSQNFAMGTVKCGWVPADLVAEGATSINLENLDIYGRSQEYNLAGFSGVTVQLRPLSDEHWIGKKGRDLSGGLMFVCAIGQPVQALMNTSETLLPVQIVVASMIDSSFYVDRPKVLPASITNVSEKGPDIVDKSLGEIMGTDVIYATINGSDARADPWERKTMELPETDNRIYETTPLHGDANVELDIESFSQWPYLHEGNSEDTYAAPFKGTPHRSLFDLMSCRFVISEDEGIRDGNWWRRAPCRLRQTNTGNTNTEIVHEETVPMKNCIHQNRLMQPAIFNLDLDNLDEVQICYVVGAGKITVRPNGILRTEDLGTIIESGTLNFKTSFSHDNMWPGYFSEGWNGNTIDGHPTDEDPSLLRRMTLTGSQSLEYESAPYKTYQDSEGQVLTLITILQGDKTIAPIEEVYSMRFMPGDGTVNTATANPDSSAGWVYAQHSLKDLDAVAENHLVATPRWKQKTLMVAEDGVFWCKDESAMYSTIVNGTGLVTSFQVTNRVATSVGYKSNRFPSNNMKRIDLSWNVPPKVDPTFMNQRPVMISRDSVRLYVAEKFGIPAAGYERQIDLADPDFGTNVLSLRLNPTGVMWTVIDDNYSVLTTDVAQLKVKNSRLVALGSPLNKQSDSAWSTLEVDALPTKSTGVIHASNQAAMGAAAIMGGSNIFGGILHRNHARRMAEGFYDHKQEMAILDSSLALDRFQGIADIQKTQYDWAYRMFGPGSTMSTSSYTDGSGGSSSYPKPARAPAAPPSEMAERARPGLGTKPKDIWGFPEMTPATKRPSGPSIPFTYESTTTPKQTAAGYDNYLNKLFHAPAAKRSDYQEEVMGHTPLSEGISTSIQPAISHDRQTVGEHMSNPNNPPMMSGTRPARKNPSSSQAFVSGGTMGGTYTPPAAIEEEPVPPHYTTVPHTPTPVNQPGPGGKMGIGADESFIGDDGVEYDAGGDTSASGPKGIGANESFVGDDGVEYQAGGEASPQAIQDRPKLTGRRILPRSVPTGHNPGESDA